MEKALHEWLLRRPGDARRPADALPGGLVSQLVRALTKIDSELRGLGHNFAVNGIGVRRGRRRVG